MKGRVKYYPESGITEINLRSDWAEYVEKPQKLGYYVEAFGGADAIIDMSVEVIFRTVYNEIQHETTILQKKRRLDAVTMLEILTFKKVVPDEFQEKIRKFKKTRNSVLHTPYAEYALIIDNIRSGIKYASQEEFDLAAVNEADKELSEAKYLQTKLWEIYLGLAK